MKSPGVSSGKLSLIVVAVTFGLASMMDGAATSEDDESSVLRSVDAEPASSSPLLSPLNPDDSAGSGAIDKDDDSNNEHKLLSDCHHSDYRTYIKCLKRHKRHYRHQRGELDTAQGDDPKRCFDECGLNECETTSCVHACHKLCLKKVKEIRQIITEYESTCHNGNGSDNCPPKPGDSGGLGTTNITTNIDINNVINNHIPQSPSPTPSPPTPPRNPCGPNGPNGPHGPNGCSPFFPFGTQLQLVPQLTLGLGLGFGPNIFNQPGVDCSYCGNPMFRYRCDVSCYPIQNSIPTNVATSAGAANCNSPHCVGGTT